MVFYAAKIPKIMYLCAVFLDDDETPNTTVDCGDRFDGPHPSHSLCRGENIPFRLWVARGPDRHRTLLFAMSSPSTPVEISKESVDGGDFSQIPELASGDKLLALSDKAPWTERIGYNYHVLWIVFPCASAPATTPTHHSTLKCATALSNSPCATTR